ncbi:hypothetical protein QBC46DRAFT_393808 [Diplogelasinospora grovesii]|uniref:Carboxymethylenebutenolidase n=1 Tax=Diplogelasinospora grovesii TaxID=303347 RepID=A0AAN6N0N2_9PEZI|nr:hypothetical protein QBC46DRAFT_393808 [Diplogelasinospora grovesii]
MDEKASKPSSSPLPNAPCIQVTSEITIQPPLSRRGTGPGLILIVANHLDLNHHAKTLDPPPIQKWAEEGYAVSQICLGETAANLPEQLDTALRELKKLPSCSPVDKVGLVVIQGDSLTSLTDAVAARPEIAASIFYGPCPDKWPAPVLAHIPKTRAIVSSGPAADNVKTYTYPGTGDFFTIPAHANYRAAAAAVAHTRSLAFLKPLLGGPYFDLETIWDEHTYYEFADRSVEDTMATMVQEPYVNHVPTMTGGIGRKLLTAFYREHFIFSNSGDAALELVSRTVGIDRIVDEFLFNCTHDRVIDWLLPGVPPTGKSLSIPFTSIVNIRGDRLFHEHIAWDQGTVLRQLGLLPEYLPFPYPLPGGRVPGDGKQFEYRVPVAGVETAHKLVDENAVLSNEMLKFATREVDKKSP